MKVVISGLGLMGGSLALALSRFGNDIQIWGYDQDNVLNSALNMKAIHQKLKVWPEDCADADIVFLATPVEVINQQLRELSTVVSEKTIVTDLGSTKSQVMSIAENAGLGDRFVGGHPLTGSEKRGLDAANPLLYENAIYVLTTRSGEKQDIPKKLLDVLGILKARVLHLKAQDHDRIVAYISHLPQLISIAMMNLVGGKNDTDALYLKLAAGGFRDLTRIASSPYSMWKDIVSTNVPNIRDALKEMVQLLERYGEDFSILENAFEKANAYKRTVPADHKGFISPLVDVVVTVRDQVGVIANISNALFRNKIDIRDIELIKMREGEGGIFRLSFSNKPEAEQAIRILNEAGYESFIR